MDQDSLKLLDLGSTVAVLLIVYSLIKELSKKISKLQSQVSDLSHTQDVEDKLNQVLDKLK